MSAKAYITRPKLLDMGDRSSSITSNNQQYHDSFNSTNSTSRVTSDTGNTTVTLGGASEWLDKLLPVVVIAGLIIAGITALRSLTK